jgi:hypothetical protein
LAYLETNVSDFNILECENLRLKAKCEAREQEILGLEEAVTLLAQEIDDAHASQMYNTLCHIEGELRDYHMFGELCDEIKVLLARVKL